MRDISAFAKIVAVGCGGDIAGAARALVILIGSGKDARLDRSDLGGVSGPGVSPIALSRRGEFRVVCRMIERPIEKDADVLSVLRLDKVLELGERLSAALRRIGFGGGCCRAGRRRPPLPAARIKSLPLTA